MANYVIALVYTGMPIGLVRDVENALKAEMPEDALTFRTFSDPSIIADAIANGRPSSAAVQRLVSLYIAAANSRAQVVLNICSSIGDIAALAQPLFDAMGVPLVRIDEQMASYAAQHHKRIGVMATLPTTLEPTKRLIYACAKEKDAQIETVDLLAQVFGAGEEAMASALLEAAMPHVEELDCLLLAQGSMHPAAKSLGEKTGLKVYSSPSFGAKAVREVLKR